MDGESLQRARAILAEAGADLELELKVDLDKRTAAGTLSGRLRLRKIAEKFGGQAPWVLEWVPDVEFDSFSLVYDPAKKALALVGAGGSAGAAKPEVELILGYLSRDPQPPSWLVGIDIAATVDLGGVPLLGSLLTGTSVGPVGVRYATGVIPAEALPAPAPKLPEVKAGLSLGLTVFAAGTEYPFSYNRPAGGGKQLAAGPAGVERLPAVSAEEPPGAIGAAWFDVDRSFGPLTVGRVGIEANDEKLGLAFDAGLKLAALSLGLTGFRIAFDKEDFSDFEISIEGLAVAVDSPSLTVQGGLIHRREPPPSNRESYDGALVIQAGGYGISAIGSFTEVEGAVSMFVFGIGKGRFGGPPAFFVTGVAAGFGYNRALRLPKIDQVAEFPFVVLAQGSGGASPDAGKVLQDLSAKGWVPPQVGAHWVAAGIKGTSFGIADTFALLSIEWGSELVIALLGTSQITLPRAGPTYAKATLALSAVLRPAEGTFQLSAQLTPDSYVIDPGCKLTGGFAFWLWFGDNQHAGDFVVTLGGYNPIFGKPDWYPSVPRLGFDWQVSGDLRITGNAYFALTPSCVMAGGALSASYESGDLSAWFTAHADFILWWRPFYYDVSIGVSVGASYNTSVLGVGVTLSASLSADVHLWGPQLAGEARVKWWVISFTVPINGGGSPSPPGSTLASWAKFEETFLPQPQTQVGEALEPASPEAAPAVVLSAHPSGGLTGETEYEGAHVWQVSSHELELAIHSAVPATKVEVGKAKPAAAFNGPAAGVYPLAVPPSSATAKGFASTLRVRVEDLGQEEELDVTGWTWDPVVTGVPEALWGVHNDGAKRLGAEITPGLVGVSGAPVAPARKGPGPFPVARLGFDYSRPLPLPLTDAPVDGAKVQPGGDTRPEVGRTIAADPQTAAREGIVTALNVAYGEDVLVGGKLEKLAAKVEVAYQWGPLLGKLGTSGAPSKQGGEPLGSPRPLARASRARRPERRRLAARFRPLALFRRPAPGSLLAHVADDHASPHDRLALAGAYGEDGGVRLTPGTTFAWSVEPGAFVSLEGDGALPLRLTAVDCHGRVLAEEAVAAGDPLGRDLPPGTALLALGCDPPWPRVAGWDSRTPLAQLGPYALLGEGCVVRGQGPHRLSGRARRGTRGVGATSGRTLVEGCLVEGENGSEPGFVETTLPAGTRTVVLSLRPETASPSGPEAAAAVAATVEAAAGAPLQALPHLEATGDEGRAHLAYAVGEREDPSQLLRTVTRATAGWVHDGVFGHPAEPESALAEAGPPALGGGAPVVAGDRRETLVALR